MLSNLILVTIKQILLHNPTMPSLIPARSRFPSIFKLLWLEPSHPFDVQLFQVVLAAITENHSLNGL